MPITTKAGNIVITGIKNLIVKTKTTPKTVIGDFDTLIDIILSDSQAKSELRAGYQAPVRLTVYGDRTTTLSATLGAFSPELLRVMTGNVSAVKTVATDVIDKGLAVSSGTTTLTKGTPSVGEELTVYVADDYGRNGTLLSAGTPASDPTKYSISGSTITVHTDISGKKLNVYYMTDKEVESIEAKGGVHPIYEMAGICVCTDIDSGQLYRGVIFLPSAQIGSDYSLSGKNSSDVPGSQSVEISCLNDKALGYPYKLDLEQIANDNF